MNGEGGKKVEEDRRRERKRGRRTSRRERGREKGYVHKKRRQHISIRRRDLERWECKGGNDREKDKGMGR